ncbi:unnamed protein product [Macrosiphum euphorbiae]|uniref:Uncharacterized protein n=1 Tax=Macrosiphum euphorbiae TaxID=13131 RepID=A0AAV0XAV8_9HEMI|nr:unnamed protein product [Macrosiphum euphorbiae]
MKPAKSGAGVKTNRTYYSMESMQFKVPYIKALGAPSGNLPNQPEQKEDKESEENDSTANEENVLEPQCSFQQSPTPSLPYLHRYRLLHHYPQLKCLKTRRRLLTVSLSLFYKIYQTENGALRTQLIKHSSNTSKPKNPER